METVSSPVRPDIHYLPLLGVVLIGFGFVGPLVGVLLAIPFFNGTLLEFMGLLNNPIGHPEIKLPFYIAQGTTTLIGLVVLPGLFVLAKKQSLQYFAEVSTQKSLLYVVAMLATITFMLVNSPFIEWNEGIHFPEFLKSFEEWARSREDVAARVTEFLTTFDSLGELLIGLLVIAVIPGIGEEFVFRGLLQPSLHKRLGNIHVAIWISAILFSAMHMQFFGFVPRVLLGALFGYLYYWSGNFWIAVFAHFVNNAFSVLMLYFYQQGVSELDMTSTEAAPWSVVVGAAIVSFALLYFFKKQASTTTLT